MSICLLDTSVFVEFLNVPNMNTRHAGICDELKQKIRDGEFLFLPLVSSDRSMDPLNDRLLDPPHQPLGGAGEVGM